MFEDNFVIVDLETTGLSPQNSEIIEIGAIKVVNNEVVDTMDVFVRPSRPLSWFTTNLTGITNEMVEEGLNCEEALRVFDEFSGDLRLLAHNAKFDMSFINMAYLKYDLGRFKNTVIDTLGLSRYLESNQRYHNLAALVIRYNIPWDEEKHHRANYDAEGTALIFYKMLEKLRLNNINTIDDLKEYRTIVLKYNYKK